MRCIVVDDEHLARKVIETYIEKIPDLELVGSCRNALEAHSLLGKGGIDLMFLDIQMPDLTGLELLRSLKNPPVTIFTTAYDQHALSAFDLDAVDYLLKPIAFDRFLSATGKANELVNARKGGEQPPVPGKGEPSGKEFIYVKADLKWVKIRLAEVLYVEGMREYVSIHREGKRVITYQSMKNMETILPQGRFVRCHKSYIVALDKIDAVHSNRVEIGEKEIPIGKNYKSSFFSMLGLD